VALALLHERTVNRDKLIGVREIRCGSRTVQVELFRNAGGSVAARCLLSPEDVPIIDGRDADEALAAVEDALEGLLLARRASAAAGA
jgi:hypothetical protein